METITIDDFKKMDIRVGKIITAESVEGADKLIKFSVDFGEEQPRQILSAIKEWYQPQDLVGEYGLFIINLEPRVIRGFTSHGMLMAVGDDKPIFLVP